MPTNTTRALYFLDAEDTEASPSSYVDLDNATFPIIKHAGALGYSVQITSTIRRIIPHSRVLFVEETTTTL